jgi:hypothetical protein
MKARKVKDLDPDGTLADNAQRVVAVRIDELYDFVPAVLDPKRVKKLHAMRIAAKRLRYVLEVTSSACFGPYALTATKRVRELQDLLGEIHDCDVQLPRVQQIRAELSADAAAELALRAGGAADLDPALASALPADVVVLNPPRAGVAVGVRRGQPMLTPVMKRAGAAVGILPPMPIRATRQGAGAVRRHPKSERRYPRRKPEPW